MAYLWGRLRLGVQRLAEAGRLAEGWTVDEATDWVWAATQPGTWERLVVERGWSPDAFVERSVRSLFRELVTGTAAG